jgi:hypothetical protein
MPLKVSSLLGVAISTVAMAYATVFLVKTLIFGIDVPGFPSLFISILFLSGVQLISLGVIGEYLGRVYEEVKARPLFLVSHEIGFERSAAGSGVLRAAVPGNGRMSPNEEPC